MEPANKDDFQLSTTNSHSLPKRRNKLASKHRMKLQCEKEHDQVRFSPISLSFKRNTSPIVADSVNVICGQEGNVTNPVEGGIYELSKHTETSSNENNGSMERTVNSTVCFNSESISETHKHLYCTGNKSSLDSSSFTVIHVGDVERKAGPAIEVCLQEFGNETKYGHVVTEASNEDASDKSHRVSLGKVNGIEVETALDCMNEAHIICKDGTRRPFKCPLCWKIFEKNQTLSLHMKGCATRHNLTTQQLLSALELQERQAAERQALGLPDMPTAYTTNKSSKKSGNDSNMQLALALSASLQEAEDREQLANDESLLEAGLGHEVVEQQKLLWERFGFRKPHPAILPPASSRHKSVSKKKPVNPVLMRRTKEEREMLITEKVAIILMGEDNRSVGTTENIPNDTLSLNGLVDPNENLQKFQNKSCLLWNIASVSCSQKELESYYVKELSKFIHPSKVLVGSKLKHLSQIPGRSKTPERDVCSPIAKIPLAQMMASPKEERKTLEHGDSKARQSFVVSQTGGSAFSGSHAETLISDWKSVLNKSVMSDLTIYVEKDLKIPAHKLVLYVRCKAILKDVVSEVCVETNEKISDMLVWADVSYRAALAFLHFIYCGVTTKILHLEEDDSLSVKKLAERYHVSELLNFLRILSDVRSKVHKNRNSSLHLSVSHDCKTDHRKHNSFHERTLSNQCSSSGGVPPPCKQVHSNSAFNSYDNSTELSERYVSSETYSKEFHESAETGLCSGVIAYPEVLIKDLEEPDVKPLTQESMTYLINMIQQPLLSQNNTQVNSSLMSSDKLSEINTQTSSPEVSSDKPFQSNNQVSSVWVSLDELPQIDAQASSSQMSSDKQFPTISCADHHPPSLQNSVTVSYCEVPRPSDTRISSLSQLHDKCVSSDTDVKCVEESDFFSSPLASRNCTYIADSINNGTVVKDEMQTCSLDENSADFQQSSRSEISSQLQLSEENQVDSAFDGINFLEHLLSDPHTRTSSTLVQGDVKERVELKRKYFESDAASDNYTSYTKKICTDRLENKEIKTFTIKSEINESSDNLKELENNIKVFDLTQSSTDSDFTDDPKDPLPILPVRECVVVTNIESEKNSISSTTECADVTICNKLLMKSEESKTSHETSECKYFDSDGEIRGEENIVHGQKKESLEEETPMQFDNKKHPHDWDEFDEMCHASVPQIFSQCLSQLMSSQVTTKKSLKSSTSSPKSKISQRSSTNILNLSPCSESVIERSTTNHSSSSGSPSVRKRKKAPRNVEDIPSVFHCQKSPTVNEIIENSLFAQLNETVFWRDENAPTLTTSPKQSLMTGRGNSVEHRTPIQKAVTTCILHTVTPPADYSTMKTPQLKRELKKYGLKPSLTRRQAKTMLRYIYDQLHPYITVSDSDDDIQMAEMKSSPLKEPGLDTQAQSNPVRRSGILGTLGSPVRRNIMTTEIPSRRGNLVTKRRRNTTSQSGVGSDPDDLPSSQEWSSSSEETVTEEELCDELDVCSQGDICLSQDADLATVIYNFIVSDPSLHQKVLLYEPIWLEELQADLKTNNLKCKLHQLMDYLDEQCITFRTSHGQHGRQKKKLMQEAKRQKSTKKKRNLRDTKLTTSSAANNTHDS